MSRDVPFQAPLTTTNCSFPGSIAVTKLDFMYESSGSVYPASSQADQGSLVLNQRLFARNFVGLAGDTRKATDTAVVTDFPVELACIRDVTCTSTTFERGDLVGIAENAGGTACENQKVAKVTDESLAIGRVVKREASAVTTVRVQFISKVLPFSVLAQLPTGNIAKTADYTVLTGESGLTFNTVGAGGTVVFSLPAATVGLKYRFLVGAVQELRVDPNGVETIALPSTGAQQAAGSYITANAVGENVTIECVTAGCWEVFSYVGTWTAV